MRRLVTCLSLGSQHLLIRVTGLRGHQGICGMDACQQHARRDAGRRSPTRVPWALNANMGKHASITDDAA